MLCVGCLPPRWVELQQTYGIERPQGWRSEMYIHRLPPSHGILHMPPWGRVVATHDLWPDELVDDITGWFNDLRGRWPQVEWWGQESPRGICFLQYALIATRELCPHLQRRLPCLLQITRMD